VTEPDPKKRKIEEQRMQSDCTKQPPPRQLSSTGVLRPGTVDYSHFNDIDSDETSSDDDAEQIYHERARRERRRREEQAKAKAEEEVKLKAKAEKEKQLLEEEALRSSFSRASDKSMCAACGAPNPPKKCGRCMLVFYCDAKCQRAYHPVHRSECFDAAKNVAFWGAFDKKKTKVKKSKTEVLLEIQKDRRTRALKRANDRRLDARKAAERARLFRERQNNSKAGGGRKGKGAERTKEETCTICQCEFTVAGDSGEGIVCPGSHFMCTECSGVYTSSVLGDLAVSSYPPRCPTCKVEIPENIFERQLDEKQSNLVCAFKAETALKFGEKMIRCSNSSCDHFEVRRDDPIIFTCSACDESNCLVCKKRVDKEETGGTTMDFKEHEKEGVSTSVVHPPPSPPMPLPVPVAHSKCLQLRLPKLLVERAIDSGSLMPCPTCGIEGRKDEACTHMNCPKCLEVWCYVCGMSAKNADKELPEEGKDANDIFLHNRDWQLNENRCPLYMTQILEVDENWLVRNGDVAGTNNAEEEDDRCLEYFHRFRTIKMLQEVKRRVGEKEFEETFSTFDNIKNSGFDLRDIATVGTDLLIDRTNFRREHEQKQLVRLQEQEWNAGASEHYL
jgi:hypothetical protein